MVFTTEGFFEVAIESWPEWDLNPLYIEYCIELDNWNCRSSNVVFLFSCKTCSKQYTGSTESFRSRFNNYKSGHRNFIKRNTVKQASFHAHFEDDKHHGTGKLPSLIKQIVWMILGEESMNSTLSSLMDLMSVMWHFFWRFFLLYLFR